MKCSPIRGFQQSEWFAVSYVDVIRPAAHSPSVNISGLIILENRKRQQVTGFWSITGNQLDGQTVFNFSTLKIEPEQQFGLVDPADLDYFKKSATGAIKRSLQQNKTVDSITEFAEIFRFFSIHPSYSFETQLSYYMLLRVYLENLISLKDIEGFKQVAMIVMVNPVLTGLSADSPDYGQSALLTGLACDIPDYWRSAVRIALQQCCNLLDIPALTAHQLAVGRY